MQPFNQRTGIHHAAFMKFIKFPLKSSRTLRAK